jgi:hypothetical protein
VKSVRKGEDTTRPVHVRAGYIADGNSITNVIVSGHELVVRTVSLMEHWLLIIFAA